MKEITGSLFDAPQRAIGHGVNMKGLMGAGIAAEFARRYPEMLPAYRLWCEVALPGDVMLYKVNDGRTVVNIGSQNLPGKDARYEWLAAGLLHAAADLYELGTRQLALPRIGCGIGGLKWDAVRVITQLVEANCDGKFEFIIYTPEGQ